MYANRHLQHDNQFDTSGGHCRCHNVRLPSHINSEKNFIRNFDSVIFASEHNAQIP